MIGEENTTPSVPNYDDFPLEDLRSSLAAGQAPSGAAAAPAADPAAVPAEAPADPAAAPVVEPASTPAEPPAEQPAEAPQEEVVAAPATTIEDVAARVAAFTFTENADADTLKAEEEAFLALVEIPQPLQLMLERRDAQIAELAAAQPAIPEAEVTALRQEHDAAFDSLVAFRKTDDGDYVPDTEPLRQLLRTRYPNETEQLVTDMLIEPSTKYQGYTKYMEHLRDMANLNDQGMEVLESFLETGGKMPHPSYTPQGIDAKVGEAYWNHPDRDEISAKVESAVFVINDTRASEEEIAAARAELQKVNNSLTVVQKGLDADTRERELANQTQTSVRDEIVVAGNTGYIQTTLGLLQQGREDLAKGLSTVFDDAGAKITAASFGMLINAALSDSNEYAKDAQKQLTEQGVRIDWNKAGQALGRLYQAEQKIAGLQRMNANPRAIENARNEKNTILLEIKGMNKNLTGQIVATLTKGAGTALKNTLANTPKVPAVRPRVGGDGSPIGTKPNYDDVPLDRLREVAFGRKPLESLTS